jgi:phenylpropionate dioxygenase-like ring-hydroxylating dioxygenase large terminal subunit
MAAQAQDVLESRLAVARRVVAHIRNGTSDLADAPMVNAAAVYTDPARHVRELEVLFKQTPQFVCLSTELAGPGAFRTFDETGVPIVVARQGDGSVRAFLNICRHRAARLVRETEGRANRFTCWFHGWTFAANGKLAATPEAERFEGGMAGRDHLISVPCAERHGIVFVLPTPGATLDLDAHLGTFQPVLAGLNLEGAERVKADVLPVAANWKYALDTYGEGYHFAALHKQTLAPYFRNDITIYDRYERHHRVGFVERSQEAWLDQPEADWGLRAEAAGIHYLFPNIILFAGSVSPGKTYLTIFRHYPGEAVGETRTCKTIYAFGGVKSDEHRAEVEAAFDATAQVVRTEDYVTAAEGWKNLTALPPEATVVYGRQEIALQYQHRAIAEAIGLPLPAAPAVAEAAE